MLLVMAGRLMVEGPQLGRLVRAGHEIMNEENSFNHLDHPSIRSMR